jgi:hypothetical protein
VIYNVHIRHIYTCMCTPRTIRYIYTYACVHSVQNGMRVSIRAQNTLLGAVAKVQCTVCVSCVFLGTCVYSAYMYRYIHTYIHTCMHHTYVCACMYMYMAIYMYIYIYIYICIYTYIHTYISMYTNTHKAWDARTCMDLYVKKIEPSTRLDNTHTRVILYVCIYIYIYIDTCTYMHLHCMHKLWYSDVISILKPNVISIFFWKSLSWTCPSINRGTCLIHTKYTHKNAQKYTKTHKHIMYIYTCKALYTHSYKIFDASMSSQAWRLLVTLPLVLYERSCPNTTSEALSRW